MLEVGTYIKRLEIMNKDKKYLIGIILKKISTR
jgi:hypothetical protein